MFKTCALLLLAETVTAETQLSANRKVRLMILPCQH